MKQVLISTNVFLLLHGISSMLTFGVCVAEGSRGAGAALRVGKGQS